MGFSGSRLQEDLNETPTLDHVNSICLAHWHNPTWGGATYVVEKLAEVLDLNKIYTIGQPELKDPESGPEWIDVSEGLLDTVRRKFGRAGEYALWEDVDWRERGNPDILITSGSTTRAVITPDDTLHVNYCHSPPRWLYDLYHDRKRSRTGQLARPAIRYFRMRDQSVDHRVDRYLSNSPVIDRRIWKFYKRKSTILYPPLDLDSYYHNDDNDFFFHLGLMDKEKGVPEIVNAFSSRAERIVFAGGRGEIKDKVIEQIKRASNMEYLGFVDEEQKYELLSNCRAVIFNGVNEDFGIVPIEANASGKPCLVRNDGFPSIFVEDGYNGLIHDGTPAGIRRSLDRMDELNPNRTDFESLVEQFSLNTFEQRLRAVLAEEYKQMQRRFDAPSHEIYTADNR